MVKFKIFILFILFISCGIKTRVLENNITQVPVDNVIFKNRIFFDKKLLSKFETSAIYEELYGYDCEINNFKKINNIKNYQGGLFHSFLKFYSNGHVNSFYFEKMDKINCKNINPNYAGDRGVFYLNRNEIKLDLFTITGYSFKRNYNIVTSLINIKGDTLFEKHIKNPVYVTVYVKRKLSNEYLIFNPDW